LWWSATLDTGCWSWERIGSGISTFSGVWEGKQVLTRDWLEVAWEEHGSNFLTKVLRLHTDCEDRSASSYAFGYFRPYDAQRPANCQGTQTEASFPSVYNTMAYHKLLQSNCLQQVSLTVMQRLPDQVSTLVRPLIASSTLGSSTRSRLLTVPELLPYTTRLAKVSSTALSSATLLTSRRPTILHPTPTHANPSKLAAQYQHSCCWNTLSLSDQPRQSSPSTWALSRASRSGRNDR